MFLCLEDIRSVLFMSHLCPQGANKAYSMYLRHKNRDSVFLKNRMSYSGKICNLPPTENRAFFEDRNKRMIAFFLYYLGVADNLGKTDLSCYWLDGEIRRI